MASLRQTRGFSSTGTPPLKHRDVYYHASPVPEVITPLNALHTSRRQGDDGEGRAKSLRKVRSHLAINSSQFDEDKGFGNGSGGFHGPHSHLFQRDEMEDTAVGTEPAGRRKKQGKNTRSQSARPRDQSDLEEDRTRDATSAIRKPVSERTQSSRTQHPTFLVPKSRSRARSASPAPMLSSPNVPHSHLDDDSLSDDSEEPPDVKLRSNGRNARAPRPQSKVTIEPVSTQNQQRPSRLRAPISRATSPLPPLTRTPHLPDESSVSGAEASGSSLSPIVRPPSAMSSPPLNSLRETSRTTSGDMLSLLPSRTRSQARGPRNSTTPILSPPPRAMSAPRTLKDVTRHLEHNRGRLRRQNSSNPEADSPQDREGVLNQSSLRSDSAPSRHGDLYMKNDSSSLLAGADAMPQSPVEYPRKDYPKLRYGLALMSENGSALGDKPVEEIRALPSSRRAMTPDLPARAKIKEAPKQAGSATGWGEFLKKSHGFSLEGRNMGATSEAIAAARLPRSRQGESIVDQVPPITASERAGKDRSRSPLSISARGQLTEKHDQRQGFNGHEQSTGDLQRVIPRRQSSAHATQVSSASPSSLPRPSLKPVAVSRQPSPPLRSAMPSLLSPRTSRVEDSNSHTPSGSEPSTHSLPQLRKLVICNPDPNDRPSPSSSLNPDVPISIADPNPQDFSLLTLAASQASMGGHATVGDYIVPDDVAAEVANEDERRRKALLGLVDGLRLGGGGQAKPRRADEWTNRLQSRRSPPTTRTYSKLDQSREDDDEGDIAFFSRARMHDDDDSLLEEPEPEAEAGFREDEEEFDEEASDTQTDIEQIEQNEDVLPLPPTPKYVRSLEESDDLESGITRVVGLHQISTTSFPSLSRGTTTSNERHNNPDRAMQQRQQGRDACVEDAPEKPIAHLADSEAVEDENPHSVSLAFNAGEGGLSSSQSQSSNLVTDNELSSVGRERLEGTGSGNDGTLSSGAEALFRQLQVEADAQEAADDSKGPVFDFHLDRRETTTPQEMRSSPRSRNQILDLSQQNTPKAGAPTSLRTWRSTLPFGAYDSLAERHGPSEMKRQEIIWELCDTEQAFVKSLRLILRLFVQPLRHEDKTWIPGVPRDVARLFDWFDDIMHLHSQISSALHATRSAQYPVVIQIAETLRPFVPRLELHQPYLVRLESVSSAIEAMYKDMHSDFGEFVRIQTASPECESMNLPSFLLKPVQRLMKYPLFFKQLWEVTPRNHPDHLPTFSLLHSTDMIIRVMQEVKAREEEYELVKSLSFRIKGLPVGFQLARRERRLVAQGLLRRIVLTEKERIALDSYTDVREPQSSQITSTSRMTSTSSDASSFTGDWAYHPTRAGNMMTSETDRSLHAESIASDMTVDSQPSASRSTSRSRSSSLRGSLRHKSKESSVYAFVFTDLMILTAPVSEKLQLLRSPKTGTENKETWKLIDDVGVSRVLGVTDQSRRLSTHDHLIAVELMSMTPNHLDSGAFSDGATAVPVYFSIPDQRLSSTEGALENFSEAKAQWLDAFERCFRFTLRSLSFPSYSGSYTAGADFDMDTKSSIMSILASGLPLPMSPSQQLGEEQRGRPPDLVQEEREERGWWSLRFQQVFKEVQRSSRSPVLNAAPRWSRSQPQGGKRSETRPLILSPKASSTSSRKGGLLSLGRKRSK